MKLAEKLTDLLEDDTLNKVAAAVKGYNLVDMRKPLEQSGLAKKKDIDYHQGVMMIKVKGKKVAIAHKNKVEVSDDDVMVGDYVVGYL